MTEHFTARRTGRRRARDREGQTLLLRLLWTVFRPVLIALCVFLLSAGVVMSVWNHFERAYFAPADPADSEQITFRIKSGASLTRVANDLEEAGLIRSASVFKYYADFLGLSQKIQSGDYALTRGMSLAGIAERLTCGDGNPLVRTITVIPGWTVRDIAEYLKGTGQISDTAQFLALCQTGTEFSAYYYVSDILADPEAGSRLYALEGYLAPDTYEIYTSAPPADIVRKLLSQTGAVFTESEHERSEALGMTMDQVMTLASLVEKEAGAADFARVSAVFHNRLRLKMPLGSDASVKYASGVDRLSLNDADLNYHSPYNTYLNTGLPPGPICSPSRAAIQAALYPDEDFIAQGYLYFCTKEPDSGELAFARTLEEHNANVNLYAPLWRAWDEAHGKNR
ncbi:MAG: endolytic transglycosylase MltG [Clostridia bacterium]|nr:endolytic transglycosylase MltG [Clostridia bacterium]